MATKGIMTKRIPTILGVFILIGGLIAGVVLVNTRQGLESQAGPTESPKNVRITNRNSTTFSASWTTDNPLTGLVRYSEDPANLTTPAGDIRDQISGTSGSYTNHLVNITGLNANTTYYFVIVSGSGTYDDNGRPFQVRTTPQAAAPPEDAIFGKINGATGDPVNGAIIFVEVEGGETLSAISTADGTWRLNLANSRDPQGSILSYDPDSALLSIFVQAGSAGTATALTNTANDTPVPDIALGRNQSFIETGSLLSSLEATETATIREGFRLEVDQLTLSEQIEATSSVKILNPAINNEVIATTLPQFMGKAPAGTSLQLSLDPEDFTQVVLADIEDNWTWTPSAQLEQGAHTLTVSFVDENNQTLQIFRTFSVIPGAGLPAFTATPSATITATPSATIILTPTPTESMPEVEEEELVDAGGLSTTLGFVVLGIALLLFGNLSKKWIQ